MLQRSPAIALLCACITIPCLAQDQRPSATTTDQTVDARPAVEPTLEHPQNVPARPASIPATQRVDARPLWRPTPPEDSDYTLGSTYISVDSWMYPALLRLYSMGYLDTAFLSMRPWTRRAVLHMLLETQDKVMSDQNDQAVEILASLLDALQAEEIPPGGRRGHVYGMENGYVSIRQNSGPVLRDSFHLGQSYINDYGRPYGEGFNTYDGFSSLSEYGPFSLHLRGEYQHAAGAQGYDYNLANTLSYTIDSIPYSGYNLNQATIPAGRIGTRNDFRLIDAYLSVHVLNHEVSFGKIDNWTGPSRGAAMEWSNNADNIYALRVNRVEPLYVPLLSRLVGPMRYDFFIGSLQGHTAPNAPWVHHFQFAFTPTSNFQFSFERTVLFGGEGHQPVTLHTFLKTFFSLKNIPIEQKFSADDEGARFSNFSFSYRLPFVRRYATLTLDSISHDDVTPPSAPRRAAFRTGVYMPQLPKLSKWSARVEAALTDPGTSRSVRGAFIYAEGVQLQGTTNKGFLLGDWLGREGKGGQAWVTYHMSPTDFVEFEYRRKKNAKDFVPLGTTENTYTLSAVKRIRSELELSANVSYQQWKAPIYKPGAQGLTTGYFQVKWYPHLKNNLNH